MLIGLAHAVGWPVVAGGSARITDAMAAALVASGGRIETGRWVRSLAELPSARAILLDVSPRALAQLAGDALPRRYRAALRRFRYGPGVCKVDFALSGPVPWTSEPCRRAGTLHLGGTFEQVAAAEAEVAGGQAPGPPLRPRGPARRRRSVPRPGRAADAVDLLSRAIRLRRST